MPTLRAGKKAITRPYLILPDGCESASFFFGGYGSVVLVAASGTGFSGTRCRSSDVVMACVCVCVGVGVGVGVDVEVDVSV